jgi:ferredoxin
MRRGFGYNGGRAGHENGRCGGGHGHGGGRGMGRGHGHGGGGGSDWGHGRGGGRRMGPGWGQGGAAIRGSQALAVRADFAPAAAPLAAPARALAVAEHPASLALEPRSTVAPLESAGFSLAPLEARGLAEGASDSRLSPTPKLERVRMIAQVDDEQCSRCGICIDACPDEAISLQARLVIDAGRCTGCGSCVAECPFEALSLRRQPPARAVAE